MWNSIFYLTNHHVLLEIIWRLQSSTNNQDYKILIFKIFKPWMSKHDTWIYNFNETEVKSTNSMEWLITFDEVNIYLWEYHLVFGFNYNFKLKIL